MSSLHIIRQSAYTTHFSIIFKKKFTNLIIAFYYVSTVIYITENARMQPEQNIKIFIDYDFILPSFLFFCRRFSTKMLTEKACLFKYSSNIFKNVCEK